MFNIPTLTHEYHKGCFLENIYRVLDVIFKFLSSRFPSVTESE